MVLVYHQSDTPGYISLINVQTSLLLTHISGHPTLFTIL